jgi:hypothetical protein
MIEENSAGLSRARAPCHTLPTLKKVVGYEFVVAMILQNTAFWYVTPCN